MFPLAYVYPHEKRALRDLLRRRLTFVHQRTELLRHMQLLNYQENLEPLGRLPYRKKERDTVPERFQDPERQRSAETDLALIKQYEQLIAELEWYIFARVKDLHRKEVAVLTSAPGIGRLIALTIICEIDDIRRFTSHQQFASYCRLIKCPRESGGKKYGFSGVKIGNPYLKNAFCEAAILMAHHNPRIEKYLTSLENKHGKGKGKIVLAHKICRAVYYMLKNDAVFDLDYFLHSTTRTQAVSLTA